MPLPLLHHRRRILREPEEFRDVITGMDLRVEFRRCPTKPSLIEQFQTAEWALDFGQAHPKLNFGGTLPGGWYGMCLGLAGDTATHNGRAVRPGTLSCLPCGDAVEGSTPPDYEWLTIALRPERWAECRAIAGLEDDDSLSRFETFSLPDFPEWLRRIHELHGRLRMTGENGQAPESAQAAGLAFAMSIATEACELARPIASSRDSLRNRARLARRAAAWMRDRLAETIHMPDVCRALRVSRRELEYAFRTVYDQSPRDFLHTARLHAIRQALLELRDNVSVLEVSLAHGVQHAGRFAADYRKLFGESPMETKRRGASFRSRARVPSISHS